MQYLYYMPALVSNNLGMIKIREGQFPYIAWILLVRGDVIPCAILGLQKEIWVYNSNNSMEDVNS